VIVTTKMAKDGCEAKTQEEKGMTRREMFNLRPHVVCILDVLGQKDRLAEWAEIDVGNPAASMPAIKKTAGTIVVLEKMVRDFLAAFDQPPELDRLIASLPEDKREAAARFKDCSLGTQQFADTFVFYAPTANSFGDVSPTALYRVLTGCCTTMLTCLAAGVAMRGSICVGWGVELEDHNFYGPALGEAHRLETTVAEYPRIVVAESTLRFIQTLQEGQGGSDIDKLMSVLASQCRAMVGEHDDGIAMVDFLGEGFRCIACGPGSETLDRVKRAYRFTCSEAERFKSDGNEKLAGRYERVRRYIEYRLPIWGVKKCR